MSLSFDKNLYFFTILSLYKNIFSLLFFFLCCCQLYTQNLSLFIKGKDSTETKIIEDLKYKSDHPSFSSIQKEVKHTFKKLERIGYINIQSTPLQKIKDSVYTTTLNLNKKQNDIKVFYSSDQLSTKQLQKIGVKNTTDYFIIPFTKAEETLQKLNDIFINEGKPFSNLKLIDLALDKENQLIANLHIDISNQRLVDSITIKGYEKFPKSYIKNFIRIKKGQVFNKTKLDKKVLDLKNLNFVNVPRNPEVLFTKDQTVLYLYLEKKNSNNFEGFLGFSTDEETGNFQLDGDISLSLVNNLNYGESLAIHYKNTGTNQQHFNTQLKLPYIFSTPFGVKLELDLFKQDSSYTTNSQSAKLNYQINSKWEIESGYKNTSSTDLLKDNSSLIGQNFDSFDAYFITFGGNYLDRNTENPLFPIQTDLNFTIGFGQRDREAEKSNQQNVVFSGAHIFNIDYRNSIYVSSDVSVLFSDNYISNELFRFGGVHSVRGFEENSLSASFFSGIQSEYRFLLSPSLYAHSIIDYAHLKNDVQNEKNNLYGIGFGLGLQTKAGLLNLAFANGKSDGESFKFENTKVHISLIASF